MTMLGFTDLPLEALKHALCYMQNVPDYLACERTCKAFQSCLSDDTLWNFGPNILVPGQSVEDRFDDRLKTHREVSCVLHNLEKIRSVQAASETNIFVDIFQGRYPTANWRRIIKRILDKYLPDDVIKGRAYFIRGDTLSTLLELLQCYLMSCLEGAVTIATAQAHPYPVVHLAHLKRSECVAQTSSGYIYYVRRFSDEEMEFANSLLSAKQRDKIIRTASFRAGIPKMDNGVYMPLWTSVVLIIRELFAPICISLCYRASVQLAPVKQYMSIRNVPPPPKQLDDSYLHVPVPRQIEDVAAKLLPSFPTKIYNLWMADDDDGNDYCNEAEGIKAAEVEYLSEDFDEGCDNACGKEGVANEIVDDEEDSFYSNEWVEFSSDDESDDEDFAYWLE